MKLNRKNPLLAAAITLTLTAPAALATPYYWDIDAATPGAGGATPSGAWDTSGTTWSPDSTGSSLTPAYTTLAADDLTFSAGTDATGSYAITLTTAQAAKSLTFEEGTTTISGGTISLASGIGGGAITVAAAAGNATISSNLTINGGTTFNIGAGRNLTLNTGNFTRGTRAALNLQGLGNGNSTMTGLSTNVNNIVGPWASVGIGAATTYVKLGIPGNVDGLNYSGGANGTAAAAAANVISTASPGTVNYNLSAAGTLGANATVNTLRYDSSAGSLASSTVFITKGIMNAGSGLLTFTGAVTAGNGTIAGTNATEIVVNTANADIAMTGGSALFTGTINKTGSGTFTLGSGAAHSVGAITVNEGVLVTSTSAGDALPGATINSGGTLRYGSSNKHANGGAFTINAGGTLDVSNQDDLIGGINGSGSATGTTGRVQVGTNAASFSGVISGTGVRFLVRDNGFQTLSGVNTYGGTTTSGSGILSNSVLLATRPASLPGYDAAGRVIFNGGTIGAQIGGSGWTTGEVDNLLANATKTLGALGIDTANGNLTQWAAFTTTNFGPTLGLTKLGANTLTLDQANTYTGNTRVVAGKIFMGNPLALQNSAYDTASVAGGLDLNGNTTPTLGGLTGSGNLSETLITGYNSISNLTLNPQAGITQTYSGNVGNGNGNMTLTKSGLGTQVLSGNNTFTGGSSVTGGALVFRNTNTKPAGTQAFGAGATLGLGVGAAAPLFSSGDVDNAFAGNMTGNLSNVTVDPTTNVGIDTTAGNFTYSTSVAGSPTRGLVKLGANTLTLTGTNTYTGTTDIQAGTLQLGDGNTTGTLGTSNVTNAGTLVFNRTNTYTLAAGNLVTGAGAVTLANSGSVAAAVDGQFNTTGALNFGATAGNTTVSALDLTNGSSTFGSMLVQTNSASNNTTTIGSGKTLQINGAVTVGITNGLSTTNLTATGPGTLSFGTSAAPTNASVAIGAGTADNNGNNGTLDVSGLSTFYANLGTGTFRVGSPTNAGGTTSGGSSAILAGTSTIQATNLNVGSPDGSSAIQSLLLGNVTNTLNVTNITVGSSGRSSANLLFNGVGGDLTVRALDGTPLSRANLTLAFNSFPTNTGIIGTFDTTAHNAFLRFDTMTVGQRTAGTSGSGSATGNFTFNQGTLDANNLIAGSILLSASAGNGNAVGNVNLSGGTATFNSIAGPMGLGVNVNNKQSGTGNLNISGTAAVTVAASSGTSIRLGDATVALGTATGNLNLTGGTLTVAGDIIRGATTGTSNATLKISGGTLDMGGNDIGAAGLGAVTLTAESGTLGNVASINGTGGLTKTTAGTLTLSGNNTYTGDTIVSGGVLAVSGTSIANTGKLDIAGGKVNLTNTETVNSLFFGGVQQASGNYTSADPSTNFTGLGTLTVLTGPVGFSGWITGTFINGNVPALQQGPNADFDNDGISNLVEYAIAGQDPTVPNATVGSFNGTLLSFSKRLDATGLTYAIQDSTDLGLADAWAPVGSYTQNDASIISYTLTPGTPPKNFLRLQVLDN